MFSVDEIQTIDQQYFNVKNTGCYQITLQSKNTRHIWNIRSQVLTLERGRSLVVYHKHKANQPYHIQKWFHPVTLVDAQKLIKSHDEWYLENKRCCRHK